MEGGEFVRVEKLQSGDDRPMWKFEIRVLLNAAEVMDVVSGEKVKCRTILQCSAIVNELTAARHIENGILDKSVNRFGCLANENKRLVKKDLHENGVKFGQSLQSSVTVDELPAMCIIEYKGFGCTVNQIYVHGTYMAWKIVGSMNISSHMVGNFWKVITSTNQHCEEFDAGDGCVVQGHRIGMLLVSQGQIVWQEISLVTHGNEKCEEKPKKIVSLLTDLMERCQRHEPHFYRQFQVTRKYPITAVVIIILDEYFHQFHNILTKLWYRMKRNKVIAVANNCMDFEVVTDFFALIWSKSIINFIYLHHCNSTVDVYTYFPFQNNQCRIFAKSNIIKLGEFITDTSLNTIQFQPEHTYSTNELSINTLPFFPDKIPLNLNRCPVKISTGIWPPNVINISSVDGTGIEVEFIKTVENKLNCNVTIHTDEAQDMGLKFGEDEEPTGRMGLLKKEKYDLLFGAVPATPNVFKDFDTTDCFLPNQLKFIVPTAGNLPSSMILWTVIEKHTKLFGVIVGIVFFLSIIIKYMNKLSEKSHPPTKNYRLFILEIFATLLRSLIETSTPILPDNKIIQLVYGIWFGSCLIISCYFNTTLTSFFAEPGHVKQIRTVEDIIRSGIPISIDELYYPIFTTDPDQIKYFRSKNVKASVPIGLKLSSIGEAATFTDVLRARHISVQWVSSYGDSSIYYVGGDKVLSYWNVMITYKGNPLLERINDIMRRIK